MFTEDCYRAVGVEGDMLSDVESNGEGAEMPGQRTATYQDGTLRATAIYNGADFPENARVNVERVDENENLPEKQEQFAELIDKSWSFVSQVEANNGVKIKGVSLETLFTIAEKLDVPVDKFFIDD